MHIYVHPTLIIGYNPKCTLKASPSLSCFYIHIKTEIYVKDILMAVSSVQLQLIQLKKKTI